MPARRLLWSIIILVILLMFVGSNIVDLTVNYLWLSTMGYRQVFLTTLGAKLAMGVVGFAATFVILWSNLAYALRQAGDPAQFLPQELTITPLGQLLTERLIQRTVLVVSLLIAVLSGLALSTGWQTPLLYLNARPFGVIDPIFGRDASFYMFTLPFLDQIQSFLWSIGFFTLLGIGGIYLLRMQSERNLPSDVIPLGRFPGRGRMHMAVMGAALLVVMAAGLYLDRFETMHTAGGLFTGPGYADIHGTLPVLALKCVTALVSGGIVIYALWREQYRMLLGVVALFVLVWVGGNVYTSMLQRFIVSPNELEKERPYLKDHIEATNKAFGLDKVVERTLNEDSQLTAQDIAKNRPTINNIRLWDHEPLLDTFSQIQEIRTYYQFASVDNERYTIGGELRQTMLSPRELSVKSLPSRTWVNERLTFTHGYGVTAGPVNRVNEQGLPVLFVQDLPPRSTVPALHIDQPEIYYGELENDYVFVKTRQKEFDYPQGEQNIFNTYNGKGGVLLDSLWRRLLFAADMQDMKMLLSEDFTDETRILINRNLSQRLQAIAPFFDYDPDPYLVIFDGKLKWIVDIYTRSDSYPYAQQVPGIGNYMRNPIKAVIDAKDGTVTFYLVQPDEPIAAAYAHMFPGLLHPISEMPEGLRAHLRHPPGFFSVQTAMYATYHMHDVNTFYNKEDQWSIPVVGNKRMEPYFTVMKLPGEQHEEFILMLPFTPRLKDNLAAWMVARSDGEHYGQMVVYVFPKQKLIFGPKQMVARINQDPTVSQQITLWDQSGSKVIRGTLLVIPIENSLIYIQPIYLKAEDGRIPELKRVVVGYRDQIAMGLDLEDALSKIFGNVPALSALRKERVPVMQLKPGEKARLPTAAEAAEQQPPPPGQENAAQRAMDHYRRMNEAVRSGDWGTFGRELDALGQALQKLNRASPQ
ncbi:MAG TPA: UPF0182 family protein [bacterium]|nr:UPF0182 family protein [bacterium]